MTVLLQYSAESDRAITSAELVSWLKKAHFHLEPAMQEVCDLLLQTKITYSFSAVDGQDALMAGLEKGSQALHACRQRREAFNMLFGSCIGDPYENTLERWSDQLTEYERNVYRNIQSLWQNADIVFTALAQTETLLAVDQQARDVEQWYEQFFGLFTPEGFQRSHEPLEILASCIPFLQGIVAQGHLPLDPGADYSFYRTLKRGPKKHGAFSHILQWLILLIVPRTSISRRGDLLGDLYKKTGQILARDTREPTHTALWTTLADLPASQGIRVDATMPQGIMVLVDACFPQIQWLECEIEVIYLAQLKEQGVYVYPSLGSKYI
ncbi:hypothetical protein EPA93_12670 [Ktedonosporobacter rubrisoli]|uniref:Uncharacterized protein n=1 Tax=Ktedonosporobacter rubrisoli TaxID=2509675 RepID=A0A4P6JNW2_KTERU|nr:hypothetical protein [Ktedonosporobacter rubrisoli]QBD76810.1 hypothetical protein EPA93_12670 [Ktedonosporobacter rubrisoli]